MKYVKLLKTVFKYIFYAAIVIVIEHAVLFSVAIYKVYVPMAGECIETFDNFAFLVLPKTKDEVPGWSSEQLLVAEIRTNDLADQTHKEVLKNKSGPIRIIGRYENDSFTELNINADLSSFEMQTASDLKIKLNNSGYVKGEKVFSELYDPLPFPLSDFPLSLPIAEKGEEFPPYILIYNDKYIRTCSSSNGNRFQFDYDFVYTVDDDDNNINVIRNTCQSYNMD